MFIIFFCGGGGGGGGGGLPLDMHLLTRLEMLQK